MCIRFYCCLTARRVLLISICLQFSIMSDMQWSLRMFLAPLTWYESSGRWDMRNAAEHVRCAVSGRWPGPDLES